MAAFPGYTLETMKKLTIVQFRALQRMAADILSEKAKAMQL